MSWDADMFARGSDPLRAMTPRFPGQLALRDARNRSAREAQVCAARFAVLQLVERFSAGEIDPERLPAEVQAAGAYVDPIREVSPTDALRLRRILDRLSGDGASSRVPVVLLAAADTALTSGHVYGAWGLLLAAFELGESVGRNAAAVSAAHRLSELARLLELPALARKWERRCGRLLSACH